MSESLDEMAAMLEGGASEDQLRAFERDRRALLATNGFSKSAIDAEFGFAPVEPSVEPMRAALAGIDPLLARTPEGFFEGVSKGFGFSDLGLVLRGKPTEDLPLDAPMAARIGMRIGELAGDLPVAIPAYAIGGTAGAIAGTLGGAVAAGPPGAIAGAGYGAVAGAGFLSAAAPEFLRGLLMTYYDRDEIHTFRDFWAHLSATSINALKVGGVGALTLGVGRKVGLALTPAMAEGATATLAQRAMLAAKTPAQLAAEVGVMTATGAALEGRMPDRQEFIDAAIVLGGLHAVTSPAARGLSAVTRNLMDHFRRTGELPGEAVIAAARDPAKKATLLKLDETNPERTPAPAGAGPEAVVDPTTNLVTIDIDPATGRVALVANAVEAVAVAAPRAGFAVRLADGRTFIARPGEGHLSAVLEAIDAGVRDADIEAGRTGHVLASGEFRPMEGESAQGLPAEARLRGSSAEAVPAGKAFEARAAATGRAIIEGGLVERDAALGPAANDTPETLRMARPAEEPPKPPPSAPAEAPPGQPPSDVEAAKRRIESRIAFEAAEGEAFSWRRLYERVIDRLDPFNLIDDLFAEGKILPDKDRAYVIARLMGGMEGRIDRVLRFTTIDWKTQQPNGPGHKAVVTELPAGAPAGSVTPIEDPRGFSRYMVSKRVLEYERRGFKSGMDPADAKLVVDADRGRFQAAYKEYIDYKNRVIQMYADAGFFDQRKTIERATPDGKTEKVSKLDLMREQNLDPVDFHRLFEDAQPGGAGTGTGLKVFNPVRGVKGGEEKILDPMVSDVKNTAMYLTLAARNEVRAALAGKADEVVRGRLEGFKELQRDAIHEMRGNLTGDKEVDAPTIKAIKKAKRELKEMEAQLKEGKFATVDRRLTKLDAPEDPLSKVMRPIADRTVPIAITAEELIRAGIDPELAEELMVFRRRPHFDRPGLMNVWRDGRPVTYEVSPLVERALHALDRPSVGILEKIMRAPASWLRAGQVLTPNFMVANVLRDQFVTFIQSVVRFNPADIRRGFEAVRKETAAYQEALSAGALGTEGVALDRVAASEFLTKLSLDTGLTTRAWNVARSPIELLRLGTRLSEESSRMGTFLRAREAGKGTREAAFLTREASLDFARYGASMRGYNLITAFFNAHVQGLDRMGRAFAKDPAGTMFKSAMAITLPSTLLWFANQGNPAYENAQQWERDLFWFVPLHATGVTVRIPKPFEYGMLFGSLWERALDRVVKGDPEGMKGFVDSMVRMLAPEYTPTFARPLVEQFANRSTFTGNPLIPDRLLAELPEYRYTEYTSETAKAVGRIVADLPAAGVIAASLAGAGLGYVKGGNVAGAIAGGLAGGLAGAAAVATDGFASPAVLENYVRGWSGGLGMYALQAADLGLRLAGVAPSFEQPAWTVKDIPIVRAFVVRYPSANAKPISDFYTAVAEVDRVKASMRARIREGDMEAAERLAERASRLPPPETVDRIRAAISRQGSLVHMIWRNPTILPAEKRQLIDGLYYAMIREAQEGNAIVKMQMEAMK
mgnify:CR=1 FL=1